MERSTGMQCTKSEVTRTSVNREETVEQSELHAAVNEYIEGHDKANCLQEIDRLFKSGKYDANVLNGQKETVLHMICNIKQPHSVSFLEMEELLNVVFRYNIDLNCKNISGKTALMLACENGHSVVVIVLSILTIEREVYLDLDAVDNSGETASTTAIRAGDEDMLHLLEQLRISQRVIFLKAVENEKKEFVETVLYDAMTNDEKFIKSSNAISYCNAKSWTYKPEYIVHESTWRNAMRIAIGKSSKDILRHLLHYYVVVQSQDVHTGDSILHRFFNAPTNIDHHEFHPTIIYKQEKMLFFKTVVESGIIDVNALNFKGETVLFSVLRQDRGIVRDPIELLLRHKLNVNRKSIKGKTPMQIACKYVDVSILRMMLNLAKETGTWLDLDAKNLNGRTALMIAAKYRRHIVVELLLNAGASVNLSDNRGFTALHHALYEELSPDQWINFGEFPRSYEELEKRRKTSEILLETGEFYEYYGGDRCQLDLVKMKTVNALLTHAEIDVNALDCEGFSPLDIAEALIPEIPSSIRDALRQKAAILNVFLPPVGPMQSDTNAVPDFKYDCPLHRLAIGSVDYRVHQEQYYKLITSLHSHTISTTDQRGRSPLHYAILCSRDVSHFTQVTYILKTMTSLGCSVNSTDVWGRTPLHYATRKPQRGNLIKYGADQTIKDKDGISAIEMSTMLEKNYYSNSAYCNKGVFDRHEKALENTNFPHPDDTSHRNVDYIINWALERIRETNPLPLFERMRTNQSTTIHVDSKVQWCKHMNPGSIFQQLHKLGKYACRHPLAEEIEQKTTIFMRDLTSAIKKIDRRFEVRFMPVGSSSEGTKINLPDEYDFSLVLTKFSQLCEVSLSPELPTGYVRLRRKQGNIHKAEELEFDSFFNKDEILITEKVKERFSILLTNVLTNPQFIKSQEHFDWDWHFGTKGLINASGYYEKKKWFEFSDFKIAANLKLNRTKFYPGEKDIIESVSVDIAPCIQIDGWWPEEAITNVNTDIKSMGCILVFDRPQRLFSWVPYSGSCVRISFGPAESKLIRQSSEEVKEIYMMAKQLITTKFPQIWSCETSYILKTSLLYCIETSLLMPEMFITEWLELLMKCYLDFVLKDFCPCYFMPNFCMPNTEYIKYSHCNFKHDMNRNFELYQNAYMLCRCVSLKASKNIIKLTRLNPIWEQFDREEFISDLLEFALKNTNVDCVYLDCGLGYCDEKCKTVLFRYFGRLHDSQFSPINEKPEEEDEIIYVR